MPRTFRVLPLTLLLPLVVLLLLLVFLLQSTSSEVVLALGVTPTATSTVTLVPTATPTPTMPPQATPTPQIGQADPVIVKRGGPSEALPGEEVTFTIEVTNQGDVAAVDVVVTDEMSEYLEILEVTTTQGTVTIVGQTVTVDIGVVGPGFVVQIVIRTRVREDTPAPIEIENVVVLATPSTHDRTSPPTIIKVPGLLPVTGASLLVPYLAYVILVGCLGALGLGLVKRRMARRRPRASSS